MERHHHQVAILVTDDQLDCYGNLENFVVTDNEGCPASWGFSMKAFQVKSFANR